MRSLWYISPYSFDFTNKIFCEPHNCIFPFGGIMVLLVGDLAQLPPINAPFVFKSVSWEFFIYSFIHKNDNQKI
jgi:hypothetical protein